MDSFSSSKNIFNLAVRGNFDDFSIIRDLQGVTLQDNRLIDNEGDDQITFVEKLKFDNIIVTLLFGFSPLFINGFKMY